MDYDGVKASQVDVLIITAAEGEDEAVRRVDDGAMGEWEKVPGPEGYVFDIWLRKYKSSRGRSLRIALTRAFQMGVEASGYAAAQLTQCFKPQCLAMSGVCAGRPKWTNLGDVIIADRLWRYDVGELVNPVPGGRPMFRSDNHQHILDPQWLQAAQNFVPSSCRCLEDERPRPQEHQRLWLLKQLLDGHDPLSAPDRKSSCADWSEILVELTTNGYVLLRGGRPELTDAGREFINNTLCQLGGKLPDQDRWKIHVGPLGTGSNLIRDVEVWDLLESQQRHVCGLDMEGSVIGLTALLQAVPRMIVVKGVMDYGSADRHRGFRAFAARAAAEVLIAFVCRYIEPPLRCSWDESIRRAKVDQVHVTLKFHERGGLKQSIGDLTQVLKHAGENGKRLIVLLGAPGAGKTTAIVHLAKAMLSGCQSSDTKPHPILVDLSRPMDIPGDLCALIQEATRRDSPQVEYDDRQLLDNGECVVFLDGLDKLTHDNAKHLAHTLEDWHLRYPRHVFVLASRFHAYAQVCGTSSDSYFEICTADFGQSERSDFLNQWCAALKEPADDTERLATDLLDAIGHNENLRRLAANPLLLRMMADVYCHRRTKPEHKVRLYCECVDTLLDAWDVEAGCNLGVDADQARAILQAMAWSMQETSHPVVRQREALEAVRVRFREVVQSRDEHKDAIRDVLRSLREKSGLFHDAEDDCGEEHYELLDEGFRFLLAAEEVRNRGLFRQLAKNLTNKGWRDLILMTMGLLNPSVFVRFMQEIMETKRFARESKIMLDCLHSARFRSLSPFQKVLATGRTALGKYNAVLALRENGAAEAVDSLRQALKDHDPVVAGLDIAGAAAHALALVCGEGREMPDGSRVAHDGSLLAPDGSVLCRIPAGQCECGVSDMDIDPRGTCGVGGAGFVRCKPQVYVAEFYIGRYPVTNAQFQRFCDSSRDSSQRSWEMPNGFERPNQPAVNISWDDAMAYCDHYGVQLPTESQWEKAARGRDGQLYPWGNRIPMKRNGTVIPLKYLANCKRHDLETSPVGCYPEGISPYGCMDMAGNVWEWCRPELPGECGQCDGEDRSGQGWGASGERALRGGAWLSEEAAVCCTARLLRACDARYNDAGFRVVYLPRTQSR